MSLHAKIKEIELHFETAEGVFSPRNIDKGTLAMLSVVDFQEGDKILDLGCGYGVVGIYAAKLLGTDNIVLTDIDESAVELSRQNALRNGVPGIRVVQGDALEGVQDKDFTVILSNPPYHVDFSVPKKFIEKGFNRLCVGGRMIMVTKRRDWYKNKLSSIFGGVKVWEIDGYFVFMAVKKSGNYANKAK